MHWFELAANPQVVGHIYGPETPSLAYAILAQHTWKNGPASTVSTTFQLPKMPDSPPAKWVQRGYNAVLLNLSWIAVRQFEFVTGPAFPAAKFQLTKLPNGLLSLSGSSGTARISIQAEYLYIDSFSGYSNITSPIPPQQPHR